MLTNCVFFYKRIYTYYIFKRIKRKWEDFLFFVFTHLHCNANENLFIICMYVCNYIRYLNFFDTCIFQHLLPALECFKTLHEKENNLIYIINKKKKKDKEKQKKQEKPNEEKPKKN